MEITNRSKKINLPNKHADLGLVPDREDHDRGSGAKR